MSITATETQVSKVPANYAELFSLYYPYMVRFVRKSGIVEDGAEDVAMNILIKFFEKDALADFDPEYTTEYKGVARKAAFRTYFTGFVVSYVRHHRERQNTNAIREGVSLDAPSRNRDGETVGDELGAVYEETYEDLHTGELIRSIRAHLATVPKRNDQDKCDLLLFFDMVNVQVTETGKLNNEELAELFAVSKPTILSWKKRLRIELAPFLGA